MLQGAQATRAQLVGIGPQLQRLAQVLWRFKVQLPEERVRAGPPRTRPNQSLQQAAVGLLGGVVQRLVVVGVGAGLQQECDNLALILPQRRQLTEGRVQHRLVAPLDLGVVAEQPHRPPRHARLALRRAFLLLGRAPGEGCDH
jgi:hypothetical protein